MSDVTVSKTEGWTWLANAAKWHYFRNSRSLCGKWMYLGSDEDLENTNHASPDNCRACIKKLAAEQNRIAKAWAITDLANQRSKEGTADADKGAWGRESHPTLLRKWDVLWPRGRLFGGRAR